MSQQLDLLAPSAETVAIKPTSDVIRQGAKAPGVPRHEHVPSRRPKALRGDDEWLEALRVAEEVIRWRSWTHPRLCLDEPPAGCVGGGLNISYDSKGVCLGRGADRRCAGWSALLRGLREQREREPRIGEARDLAHAYHALEQYDRFYVRDGGSVPCGGDPGWRQRVAVPWLEKLRRVVVELGGDAAPVLGEQA